MKKGLFILLLCISHNIFSQDISQKVLQEYEDTLSTIAHTIMHGENEKVRQEENKGFISELWLSLNISQRWNSCPISLFPGVVIGLLFLLLASL